MINQIKPVVLPSNMIWCPSGLNYTLSFQLLINREALKWWEFLRLPMLIQMVAVWTWSIVHIFKRSSGLYSKMWQEQKNNNNINNNQESLCWFLLSAFVPQINYCFFCFQLTFASYDDCRECFNKDPTLCVSGRTHWWGVSSFWES